MRAMEDLARLLLVAGAALAALGAILLLAGRIPWLGRLPGDIAIERENVRIYIPIATCLLVSAAITLVLWAVGKLRGGPPQ